MIAAHAEPVMRATAPRPVTLVVSSGPMAEIVTPPLHVEAPNPPRLQYQAWVEEQIEDYKACLTRDELLTLADEAVQHLVDAPDGQYTLTEIMVCDAVDRLIVTRLKLPTFRRWERMCHINTCERPLESTPVLVASGD